LGMGIKPAFSTSCRSRTNGPDDPIGMIMRSSKAHPNRFEGRGDAMSAPMRDQAPATPICNRPEPAVMADRLPTGSAQPHLRRAQRPSWTAHKP
jgi:hypothetical protein